MEQLAEPCRVYLTDETAKLVSGFSVSAASGEALSYEALLRRVRPLTRSLGAGDVPVLPGDEIPTLNGSVLSTT
jgi:hypothetical protein